MKIGDRVRVMHPAHNNEKGTIEIILKRHGDRTKLRIALDDGSVFLCDDTQVKLCQK